MLSLSDWFSHGRSRSGVVLHRTLFGEIPYFEAFWVLPLISQGSAKNEYVLICGQPLLAIHQQPNRIEARDAHAQDGRYR